MKQFHHFKQKHPDCILFFRMGDFYETFYEDAKTCSRVLGLTLTSRDKNSESPVPLAGVPYHAVDGYLKKMLQAGFRVAVCEQMEDPKTAKGVVKRDVVRIVTPGTLTDDMLLEDKKDNFLCAIDLDAKGYAALSWVDISTGHFFVQRVPEKELLSELQRLAPAECLLANRRGELFEVETRRLANDIGRLTRAIITERPSWYFDPYQAKQRLLKHFGTARLEGFGIRDGDQDLIPPAGAIIEYLNETQRTTLGHIQSLRQDQPAELPPDRSGLAPQPGDSPDDPGREPQGLAAGVHRRDADRHGRADVPQLAVHAAVRGGRHRAAAGRRPGIARERAEPGADPRAAGQASRTPSGSPPASARSARARVTCWRWPARCARCRNCASCWARCGRTCSPAWRGSATAWTSWRTCSNRRIEPDCPPHLRDGGVIASGFSAGAGPPAVDLDRRPELAPRVPEAGVAADGHRESQGRLQQGLRLLHRDHQRRGRQGPGRLRPQADGQERRAVHHRGAQGVRERGAHRRRSGPWSWSSGCSRRSARRRPSTSAACSSSRTRWPSAIAWRAWPTWPRGGTIVRPQDHGRHVGWSSARASTRCWPRRSAAEFVPNDVRTGRRAAASIADHHRPEHGGQEHLHPPDRPAGADGPDGLLHPGQGGRDRPGGPHLHPRRGLRRADPRPVHLHGRDDRDGQHPQQRHAPSRW